MGYNASQQASNGTRPTHPRVINMFRLVNGEVVISVSAVADKLEAVIKEMEASVFLDCYCRVDSRSPFICTLIKRLMRCGNMQTQLRHKSDIGRALECWLVDVMNRKGEDFTFSVLAEV